MKKTSLFARKRLHKTKEFNAAVWLCTIDRCKPFSSELSPGSVNQEPLQIVADYASQKIRESLQRLTTGLTPADNESDFDDLLCAISTSYHRAVQIAGINPANEMLPPLIAGNSALQSILTRRQRFNKWEVLSSEVSALDWAIEIFEVILQASSPAQMTTAGNMHRASLKGLVLEDINAKGKQ